MISIKQISKQEFNNLAILNTDVLFVSHKKYNFYKIENEEKVCYLFSSDYPIEYLIIEQFANGYFICIDNYCFSISHSGKILLFIKIFEPILTTIKKGNDIYLFSERLSYQFSTEDFSISGMRWYSDIITNIKQNENHIEVICFDDTKYTIL